ncbi:MAG: hypothetical protein DRO95_02880, partial [Candidatus Altiarchaeales archaeon]
MPVSSIRSDINNLVRLINNRGKIKLEDAARLLKMETKSLEDLVKILENLEIIEVEYSFVGDKILKKGPRIDSLSSDEIGKRVENIADGRLERKPHRVETFLGLIKRRTAKRKIKESIKPREIPKRRKRIAEIEKVKKEVVGKEVIVKPKESEKTTVIRKKRAVEEKKIMLEEMRSKIEKKKDRIAILLEIAKGDEKLSKLELRLKELGEKSKMYESKVREVEEKIKSLEEEMSELDEREKRIGV